MFKKILIGVLVAVGGFAVFVASRPPEFSVTRSMVMSAPAATVFEQVNDFRRWQAWSPWAKLDPNAKETFEGPEAGTGAAFAWAGNNQVGEGRMTITESRPGEQIVMRLEFIKPFKAVNTTEFTFRSQGAQTLVTWTMSGKNNFIGKAMSLLMNCDKMIGGQFEKGLAQLKSVVE